MKTIKQLLILTMIVAVAGSCTKLKESPEPSSSSGSSGGGGGGGGGGNPDVYVGLWKMSDRKVSGVSVYGTLSETYTVQLNSGGQSTWTTIDIASGNITGSENDPYSLTLGPPTIINFSTHGPKEVVNKTGSQIIWKYTDPDSGAEFEETLDKQ